MPKSKTVKEADALRKLDKSAQLAQDRIQVAADKAQKMIDDACKVATEALNLHTEGRLTGATYEPYKRGSDSRLRRIEDQINGDNVKLGGLEVGQAKREEQILGLLEDVSNIKKDMDYLRASNSDMHKNADSTITTLRELMIEIRDACDDKVGILRDETNKDKIRNQQYVIGIVVGMIVLFITSTIFGYLRI